MSLSLTQAGSRRGASWDSRPTPRRTSKAPCWAMPLACRSMFALASSMSCSRFSTVIGPRSPAMVLAVPSVGHSPTANTWTASRMSTYLTLPLSRPAWITCRPFSTCLSYHCFVRTSSPRDLPFPRLPLNHLLTRASRSSGSLGLQIPTPVDQVDLRRPPPPTRSATDPHPPQPAIALQAYLADLSPGSPLRKSTPSLRPSSYCKGSNTSSPSKAGIRSTRSASYSDKRNKARIRWPTSKNARSAKVDQVCQARPRQAGHRTSASDKTFAPFIVTQRTKAGFHRTECHGSAPSSA